MVDEQLRLAYISLQDRRCEDCETEYDFNQIRLESSKDDYISSYECPECGKIHEIRIGINDGLVTMVITDISGVLISHTNTSIGALKREGLPIKEFVDGFYHMNSVKEILSHNYDMIMNAEENIPDSFQKMFNRSMYDIEASQPTETISFDFGRSSNWGFLHATIHNYLASAYTFDEIIDSLKSSLEWGGPVEKKFQEYAEAAKPILGLRHYIQHSGQLPLSFELNHDDEKNRNADILTDYYEVTSINYKKGADHHYSKIKGQKINISELAAEHQIEALELALAIGEHGIASRKEEIEEFESLDHLDIDEFTPPKNPLFQKQSSGASDPPSIASKLAQIGPLPISVTCERNEPLVIQPEQIHVQDDFVICIFKIEIDGVPTFGRIIGKFDAEKLSLQLPKEEAEFDSYKELAESDGIFEHVDWVVEFEKAI